MLGQILEHRTTIIFTNARRQAERLAAKLNELAADEGSGPLRLVHRRPLPGP